MQKKELPKLSLKVDFNACIEGERENTNTSVSSTGIELNEYNEGFMVGDDLMAEVSTKKCGRPSMEDRFSAHPNFDGKKTQFFFAVYDGHGGSSVARTLAKNLHSYLKNNDNFNTNMELAISQSFKDLNAYILGQQTQKNKSGGSTALCVINEANILYVVNLGDSTCYCVNSQFTLKKMNSEHKPDRVDESERIQQHGFLIYTKNVARIDGELAVSRAFGDLRYVDSGLIAEPEITKSAIQPEDMYLILGTDGFWDLTCEEELRFLLMRWNELSEGSMENLSQYLMNHVTSKHTTFKKDNMTLMVIDLRKYYRPQ